MSDAHSATNPVANAAANSAVIAYELKQGDQVVHAGCLMKEDSRLALSVELRSTGNRKLLELNGELLQFRVSGVPCATFAVTACETFVKFGAVHQWRDEFELTLRQTTLVGPNALTQDGMEPYDPTPRFQCPCCDHVTLAEKDRWEICSVCFWEDDGVDVDSPDCCSGANHGLTLRQARQNFAEFGACEPEMRRNVLPKADRSHFVHLPRQLPERST